MITGLVRVDLTDVKPEKQRHRITSLSSTPTGAEVVVYVGPLTVEPETVRLIREHEARLHITIEGEPYAVRRWLTALREGLIC